MSALFDTLDNGHGIEIAPDLQARKVVFTILAPDNPQVHNMQTSYDIDAAMRLGVQMIFIARLLDSSNVVLGCHHNHHHTQN